MLKKTRHAVSKNMVCRVCFIKKGISMAPKKKTASIEEKMQEIKDKEREFRENILEYQEDEEAESDATCTHSEPDLYLSDLQRMNITKLVTIAKSEGVKDFLGLKKQDLIFKILKERVKQNSVMYGEGVVEILPDGFGFLRSPEYNYLPCPDDIYISPSQIRRFGIRTGAVISGQIRSPKDNERYFALLKVEAVNAENPEKLAETTFFNDLTPIHPQQRIILETTPNEIDMRMLEIVAPLAKGQRGLIVAPPHAGKTSLIKKLANAIAQNHPEIYLIILLISERPEEITDMQRTVKAEVIGTTFDEPAIRHIQVAEIAVEKAKRMVEYKKDVVILMDSITKLGCAYHDEEQNPDKYSNGRIDPAALQKTKQILGAARNIEQGGSLTILATLSTLSDNSMYTSILEGFQEAANVEIYLSSQLANRYIFPAFEISECNTLKEDIFISSEELKNLHLLRKFLHEKFDSLPKAIEWLKEKIEQTSNNAEFLASINKKIHITNKH